MNYVSVGVLRYAASIQAAIERIKAEHPEAGAALGCTYEPEPGDVPRNERAEYLIADVTRVSAGGDIERSPQWRCREHLESELGEPPAPQPIFSRIQNPGEPE